MKAVILRDLNDLAIGDIPEQPLGPTQVRVKVAYTGICGSDKHIIDGNLGASASFPMIMGHEMSGTVVEMGKDVRVKGLKIGDRVTGAPLYYCGICDHCTGGQQNFCEDMLSHIPPGTMAENVVWEEQQLYKLPDCISLEEGCLTEPVATALHGIERADVSIGKTVLIYGLGPIGLLQVQLARLAGASKIMAVDMIPSKLKLARETGADVVVNSREEDVMDVGMELTNDVGFDCVIDATGVPDVVEEAFHMVARGGTLNAFAIYPVEYEFPFHLATGYFKEITIRSTLFSPYEFPKVISILPRLNLKPLISKIFDLKDGLAAFEENKNSENIKVLIKSN